MINKEDYLSQKSRLLNNRETLTKELESLIVEKTINGRLVPSHRLVPLNGEFYDIWDLPEDQSVFADISLGKTETVFQFSTPGAQKWLRHFSDRRENGHYGIDSIETMAYFTALDRKGPLDKNVTNPDTGNKHNLLVEYARRSRNLTPTEDIMPIFNQLLPKTHGIMITQEQMQYMYQELTGCTGPEAEQFRRDVAKKKTQKLEKAFPFFIEKAGAKIGEENAKALWEFFFAFSGYGFNFSHS